MRFPSCCYETIAVFLTLLGQNLATSPVDLAVTKLYKSQWGDKTVVVGQIKNDSLLFYPGGARVVLYCKLDKNSSYRPFKTVTVPPLKPNQSFFVEAFVLENAIPQTSYFLKVMVNDQNSRNDFAILRGK